MYTSGTTGVPKGVVWSRQCEVVWRRPHASDLDSPVRRILGAAAPIDRWREIEDRFGLHAGETWGQTETASCWSWPARGSPQTPGTVGVPSDRWEARIVDGESTVAGAGRPGELWMRPTADRVMFDGYLVADGPTALSREAWTDDGWYRTGDILQWTEDGELQFIGRQRDPIARPGR